MTDDSERAFDGAAPDGTDGVVRARYDWASTRPSTAVVETIAVALDRDETTLEPLYDSVDPDALDALLRSTGSSATANDATVTFTVADQRVTVDSCGDVTVRSISPER